MRLGELDREEIDQVLSTQIIGRIGCHADGKTYIVPIAYAWDGDSIYVHSFEGLKLRIMRRNPSVCLEVEELHAPDDWRTVVAQGTFEELHGVDAERALHLIVARCPPPSHDGTVFRIRLDQRSGRFASP